MPRTLSDGRHEHGQNFLRDHRVITRIVDLVRDTTGPIVEIGPGDGAITIPLARLGRPLTAVETDGRRAARLRPRLPANAAVAHADYLGYRHTADPHVVVGNVPFHLTTAVLRRLLVQPGWTQAVLLLQWEVARRRAGVGGATMLTAQWWPWCEFSVVQRVPARAFRPVPTVDGGLLRMRRVTLLPPSQRRPYQRFVSQVFTARGRGLRDILRRAGHDCPAVTGVLDRRRVTGDALPRDLRADDWVALWNAVRHRGRPPR